MEIDSYKYSDSLLKRKLKDLVFKYIKRVDVDRLSDRVADYIVKSMVSNLLNNGNVVTFSLIDSIVKERVDEGKRVIKVEAPYAPIVEHGRGSRGDKTFPEPQENVNPYAIEEWVKMKFGYTGDKAKRVAFAIVEVLENEGHYSYPFFEPAVIKAKSWFNLNKDKLKKLAIKESAK